MSGWEPKGGMVFVPGAEPPQHMSHLKIDWYAMTMVNYQMVEVKEGSGYDLDGMIG